MRHIVPALLSFIALASCTDPKQINLIVRTDDRPDAAARFVSQIASRTGMDLTRNRFDFGGSDGAQVVFSLRDFDTAIVIQNSLDDCPGLDPCFSPTRYSVSIFTKWPWVSDSSLRELADAVENGAEEQGAEVALMPNNTNDLPEWRP